MKAFWHDKKWIVPAAVFILAVAALSLLTGSLLGSGLKPDDGYATVIGVSQFSVEPASRNAFRQAVLEAASKYEDVNTLFMNAGASAERQSSQIRTLLEQNIDALIVDSPDYGQLEYSLQSARGLGVPLVLLGDPETAAECATLIVTDYFAMGKAAGEYMLSLESVPVNILEVQGTPRSSKAMQLQKGFRSALAGSTSRSGYVIAGYDSTLIAVQRALDSRMPNASPPVDGLFAHSEEMASGTGRVLPDIPAVAAGSSGRTAVLPANTALVYSPPGGAEAVEFAVGLLDPKADVPGRYILPFELVLPVMEDDI